MYLECISCPKMGVSCDGPNFYAMTPPQIIAWCKERKKFRGLTNEKIADMCDIPKGTVDSLFSGKHPDFKFGTIAPILKALIGGDWTGEPCPGSGDGSEEKALRERIKELEAGIQWRDDKIQHFAEQNKTLQNQAADASKRHQASQDFLREQIRGKNKAIVVLSVFLGLALAVIVVALIVDYLNRHIGFFWLDKVARFFQTDSRNLFADWIA